MPALDRPLHLIRAVVPDMRSRGGGRIVNICSIGGRIAVPHMAPYAASKFALVGLSEATRVELAAQNVLVTTVVPGLMRTGSARNASFKGKHRDEYAWFAIGASLPLVSISAERAAKQIARALRHGDPEVVLSLPARMLTKLHALAPSLSQRLLAVVDRLLPVAGGIGTATAAGHESNSRAAPSLLTRPSDRAARRNNEIT